MRTLIIDAGLLHEGLPLSSYLTQVLAAALPESGTVIALTTHPSRVRDAGMIHRTTCGDVPTIVVESGPPGAAQESVSARIGQSVCAVLAAYPADLVHVIGDHEPTWLDSIRDTVPDAVVTVTELLDLPEQGLSVRGPSGGVRRLGIPSRSASSRGARAPGSPRLGVLASHIDHPDAWTGLRGAFAALDRSDFDLLVTDYTSERAYSLWPCAGLVRPLPLRGLTDLDAFFDDVDVLLWPGVAATRPGYAVAEASRRRIPVVVIGDPESTESRFSQALSGDAEHIAEGLAGLLGTLHHGTLAPCEMSTTDVADYMTALAADGPAT